jgi:hypothetical protein
MWRRDAELNRQWEGCHAAGGKERTVEMGNAYSQAWFQMNRSDERGRAVVCLRDGRSYYCPKTWRYAASLSLSRRRRALLMPEPLATMAKHGRRPVAAARITKHPAGSLHCLTREKQTCLWTRSTAALESSAKLEQLCFGRSTE